MNKNYIVYVSGNDSEDGDDILVQFLINIIVINAIATTETNIYIIKVLSTNFRLKKEYSSQRRETRSRNKN